MVAKEELTLNQKKMGGIGRNSSVHEGMLHGTTSVAIKRIILRRYCSDDDIKAGIRELRYLVIQLRNKNLALFI